MSEFTDVINIDLASDIGGAVKARAALGDLYDEAAQLDAQLKADTIDMAKYNAEMARIEASAGRANAGFSAAMGGLSRLGGGLSGMSGNLIQAGRLLDDLQYVGEQGLRPVIGQIIELSPAFGIALLAGQTLLPVVKGIANAFGEGTTKAEAAAMDELGQKTRKTADEYERLGRYKAVQGKAEELRTAQTEAEQKRETDVTKAITEAGVEDVARGLLRANPAAFDAALPGIYDKEGKTVLKDDKGVNRTALTDYQHFADRKADLDRRKATGGLIVPGEELVIQRGLIDAKKALDEARQKAAVEQSSAAALAKYFPGGLGQLRDLVDANPDAFGPNGNQLRRDLKEAAKSPEDEAEEAAQQHLDAQEEEYRNRLARWEADRQAENDEADRQGEIARNRENVEFDQRNANAAYAAQKQRDDEDAAAMNADAMTKWQKRWHETHKGAEVFSGYDQIRDAIQHSVKADDKDPTATERLAALREISANTKRTMEAMQNLRQGPARAG